MDFGVHFHDFGTPKPAPKPKRRKHEKPVFSLSKIDVFKASGRQKNMKINKTTDPEKEGVLG